MDVESWHLPTFLINETVIKKKINLQNLKRLYKINNDFLKTFTNAISFFQTDLSGFQEIQLGGLIYGIGIIFFKSDGAIPCAHAVWHLFVAAAAGIHYRAILHHLYPPPVTYRGS